MSLPFNIHNGSVLFNKNLAPKLRCLNVSLSELLDTIPTFPFLNALALAFEIPKKVEQLKSHKMLQNKADSPSLKIWATQPSQRSDKKEDDSILTQVKLEEVGESYTVTKPPHIVFFFGGGWGSLNKKTLALRQTSLFSYEQQQSISHERMQQSL